MLSHAVPVKPDDAMELLESGTKASSKFRYFDIIFLLVKCDANLFKDIFVL